MMIPDKFRDCVFFICIDVEGEQKAVATGFLVGLPDPSNKVEACYAVTARHCIEGIQRLGKTEFQIWVNNRHGEVAKFATSVDRWHFHPDADVAVADFDITDDLQIKLIDLTRNFKMTINFGIGDEVCILGLFRYRRGTQKNIPIARTGNIAAMPDPSDKIVSTNMPYKKEEAYLIECRSTKGLSGSPVFAFTFNHSRYRNSEMDHQSDWSVLLIGLVHGHMDESSPEVEFASDMRDADKRSEPVNVGIAVVTPHSKIMELLDSEPIKSEREELFKRHGDAALSR